MKKIITIILALILNVVTAQADILKGRVVDADTGHPLLTKAHVYQPLELE